MQGVWGIINNFWPECFPIPTQFPLFLLRVAECSTGLLLVLGGFFLLNLTVYEGRTKKSHQEHPTLTPTRVPECLRSEAKVPMQGQRF